MKLEMDGEDKTNLMTSSTSLDDEVNIYIPESSTHLSVTTVLNYCKCKILNPYLRLLSFMGLRSLLNEQQEPCCCLKILNYSYTFLAVVLMVIGYILQYMACFRRDRGFWYSIESENLFVEKEIKAIYVSTCDGSSLFTFIIPGVLHLIGYLHAVYIFRSGDDEQLPILMERVFLVSTNSSNSFVSQKKLVKTLWIFVLFSIIWMLLSLSLVNYMLDGGEIHFRWMNYKSSSIFIVLKIFLVLCTFLHDMVQATIISNYCLQAQLLTSYAYFLREKLMQHPVQPLEWMRDIEDFKKLLNYLNNKIAPSVCILTIINLTFALSGLLWMFNFDKVDKNTMSIFGFGILNVILWFFIAIWPFVQAAKLTSACEVLKTVGQEARTRPYVHIETPTLELDSVLLYTTSLTITANLYLTPITGRTLCVSVTLVSIIILVMGQCHYLIPK